MEFVLARNWWALALRGVAAILLGVLAFLWPGITLEVLVLFWGAYALVDGAFAIAAVITGEGRDGRWWALLLEGLVGIAAGAVTFLWPGIVVLAQVCVFAAWAVVTGVFEIVAAIRLRRYIRGEWLLALAGVLSILLGLVLAVAPEATLVAVAWWIGAYAIAFGVLLLALGLQLRRFARHPEWPAGVMAR